MDAAIASGIKLAVCSSNTQKNVELVVNSLGVCVCVCVCVCVICMHGCVLEKHAVERRKSWTACLLATTLAQSWHNTCNSNTCNLVHSLGPHPLSPYTHRHTPFSLSIHTHRDSRGHEDKVPLSAHTHPYAHTHTNWDIVSAGVPLSARTHTHTPILGRDQCGPDVGAHTKTNTCTCTHTLGQDWFVDQTWRSLRVGG